MPHPKNDEEHIQVGQSWPRRSNLQRLHEAWKKGKLVLCLGAGVSQPYGLHNWENLVLSALFGSKILGRGGEVVGWHDYYPHYQRAFGSWMMERFHFDPLKLSRVLQGQSELYETLRCELYAPLRLVEQHQPNRTSLDGVVELILASREAGRTLPAVITLNYDDLLEDKLRKAGVEHTIVYDGKQRTEEGLPIVHVHGYLPREGAIPSQDLVFTEPAYHERSSSTFHWSVKRIIRHLHLHSVLFVGVSMADPNLRRFLDACHSNDDQPHFSICMDYLMPEDVEAEMGWVEKRAARHAREMGRNEQKTPAGLKATMADVCSKAHKYDRLAMKSLGIHPVWVDSFDDIAGVLALVHEGLPRG